MYNLPANTVLYEQWELHVKDIKYLRVPKGKTKERLVIEMI